MVSLSVCSMGSVFIWLDGDEPRSGSSSSASQSWIPLSQHTNPKRQRGPPSNRDASELVKTVSQVRVV